ncbi:TPA: hypothetical protein KNO03_003501 [Clostridioides difficile]|nr:hypothetical protein [Clostridioides difficile]HBE9895599.1 hypothetical protein [Clostridioides difficile]HBF0027134.1 hypothetical protein [Clostridioides difficile]HBF0734424.1 hypothetical protein [Clostridioides difficile]HBG3393120.1 hypothetical protein [Clostridioides difficile]
MANKFNKAMKNAERARDISSNRTTKKIRKLYKDIANEYAKKLNRVNSNTLTEQYLRESIIYLNKEYDRLGKKLKKDIESEISKVIKTTTDEQLSFFNNICDNYSVNLKPQFTDMFSKVHEDVLRQVISGSMYKDKLKLSDRIWSNIDKTKKDLDYIVSRGLAEKRGSYDIAKDLEKYVNPKVKKDYDWSKVYPKSNKKIDFNAYRLASTYITHAYQKTAKESCKKNPFVKGIKWMSSHHPRMCKVCADRNGKTYIPEELPLEHPLGKCTFEYDIPMSMEDIGKELRSWIDGEENSKLDEWFDEYGLEFAGIDNKKYNSNKKNNSSSRSSGAISRKLLDEDVVYFRKEKHAELYYEEIRKRTSDISTIAKNTGYSEKVIENIKNHVFMNKYNLENGYKRFDPSYDMALSWQRLIDGKNIKESDLILLKHERLEKFIMDRYGYNYKEAHNIVVRKYDYDESLDKEGLLW